MKKHYLAIGAITATTLLAGATWEMLLVIITRISNLNIKHQNPLTHQIKIIQILINITNLKIT